MGRQTGSEDVVAILSYTSKEWHVILLHNHRLESEPAGAALVSPKPIFSGPHSHLKKIGHEEGGQVVAWLLLCDHSSSKFQDLSFPRGSSRLKLRQLLKQRVELGDNMLAFVL